MTFDLRNFAEHYTAAWCSHNVANVASYYSPNGSLTINSGPPSVGRAAIATAAQEFMAAFPDLKVSMDDISMEGECAIYRWTLEGHNRGPSGNGAHVRISGYEVWQIGPEGLIAESQGHFDTGEWQLQRSPQAAQ